MGKIKLELRASWSKYYSSDSEYNDKLFNITKKYLQTLLETQKYLFLETALVAYGFDLVKTRYAYSTVLPEQKLRSAWFWFDKRNKIHVRFENRLMLQSKNLHTGKKYYKCVPFIVFEVYDNCEYAEEYVRQSAHRTIKKHEALKCSDKPRYVFDDFNPVAAMKKYKGYSDYTGPVPC